MTTARALILDVGHRFLALKGADGTWQPPAITPRLGERPLAQLKNFLLERIGLVLPHPSGGRPSEAPDDFAFILPPGERVTFANVRWFALRELGQLRTFDGLWSLYVDAILGGWEPPTPDLDVFHFGAEARSAANLAHLVVKGRKRATTLWPDVARRKGETIPTPGLVSVVTDGFGVATCLIRTERVDELRFAEVDETCAKSEGEGDGSLEDWRAGHWAYFNREGKQMGLAFGEDTLVMVERFRLLKVLGTSDQ